MAKPELGMKRICVSCNTRFYDLTKVPAVCPKCETVQPIDPPRMRRSGNLIAEERRPKKPVVEADDADNEAEVPEEEEDAEDATEVQDDLDDDAEVIATELEIDPEVDENER